jgi:hypothetical protein
MEFLKQHLAKVKWFCTLLMFCGAVSTSLALHPWMNFVFLTVGNGAWAVILLRMREYAAASVFIVMSTTWAVGLINYIIK